MLIFENPIPFDIEKDADHLKSVFHYHPKSQNVLFVSESGVSNKFVATKPYDTLVITSQNRNTIELVHHYHFHVQRGYVLLLANDTVLVRYNGKDKPTYTSLCSDENNRIYGLWNELLHDFPYDDPWFANELGRSYLISYLWKKDPNGSYSTDFVPPEVLAEQLYAAIPVAQRRLDSLVALGRVPKDYEDYFRYYLQKAKVLPAQKRQIMEKDFALTPEQLAFFNDGYLGYPSYRSYLISCGSVAACNGTEWAAPLVDAVNEWDGAPLRLKDYRAIFDRLTELQQRGDNRLSDAAYDMMRYFCVDVIINRKHYTKEDEEIYLEKYKALTTRFLEQEEKEASSIWGFPFRLLIFVLQLNICIAVFYSLYRLLLYKTTSFVTCRIFLLLGMALSVLISSNVICAKMLLPESLLGFGPKIKFVGWIVVGVYCLSALYLLFMLGRQVAYIIRMWRNSGE